jgi:hypothetical protein
MAKINRETASPHTLRDWAKTLGVIYTNQDSKDTILDKLEQFFSSNDYCVSLRLQVQQE